MTSRLRTTSALSNKGLIAMNSSIPRVCWRNLEPEASGEFWIDSEALTLWSSYMPETLRTSHRCGIANEFNGELGRILEPNRALSQMRDDEVAQSSARHAFARTSRESSR